MKTLDIPFIEGLESLGYEALKTEMETVAAHGAIDVVDWPEQFPHKPEVEFHAARSRTHIVIFYKVRGQGIRATVTEDNGPVWQDSCCEFFVGDPQDGTYYNFEMNCIGYVLASKRKSREDFRYFTEEQLSRIIRHTSLERTPMEDAGKEYSWDMAICIPLDLIGIDPEHLPASVRANFYKCADMSAQPHYLSWNPIDVPSPDFHLPAFFGELNIHQ